MLSGISIQVRADLIQIASRECLAYEELKGYSTALYSTVQLQYGYDHILRSSNLCECLSLPGRG